MGKMEKCFNIQTYECIIYSNVPKMRELNKIKKNNTKIINEESY